MANYLPVVLSPTVKDWLTGLPANSINSWGDLCAKFINNFQGTSRNLGLSGIFNRSHKRKTNPSGVHQAVHEKEEHHPGRQRRSRHGFLQERGQGSRPTQEAVTATAENGK